jgi:hypothetical protein
LPTEGTRYVQALLLTATAYLQYRAHFLPAAAAYRGYGRPAVPKVPVQALRACLAIGHGTLPLPSVAWSWCPARGRTSRSHAASWRAKSRSGSSASRRSARHQWTWRQRLLRATHPAKRMGSHAATSACACRLPKRAERAVGRMWAARVLGYRLTLLASRRRLLLRAVLGAVVAFVSRPLRPL